MIFITGILKEVQIMNNSKKQFRDNGRIVHPFRVIMQKEISDHVRSWRFIILIAIIALTCFGSIFTALLNIGEATGINNPERAFFFLKLFTASDGTLPSFVVFISLLGPLFGIGLGFDAINSEHNKGTLSHLMAQPLHRDHIINAKFAAALLVISVMLFALGFFVMGAGLIFIGIPPTAEEFLRFVFFTLISIVYVAFWLNLSVLFSVRFRQPATSALAGIAIWLFLTVFFPLIVNLITKPIEPSEFASAAQVLNYAKLKLLLMQFLPNELFTQTTTTLLMPNVRSIGPLTIQQIQGTIPGPLPLGQSLLLVWPQVTALIAGSIVCFLLSYVSFMRREIRSR